MMLACDYSDSSEQTSRKFAKTCVEKKRRDRINKSLDELKDLMALTDERARYQKLEKAEILEMTVNYIRNLKRTMNNTMEDYENGYKQCSEEMWKLIYSLPNVVPEQRERLANRCRQMWTSRHFANNNNTNNNHHHHHYHHPYQRRTATTLTASEQYSQQQSSSHLKILVNHSSMTNPSNPCSSLSSASSNGSTSSLSPSSPKLWKPYM